MLKMTPGEYRPAFTEEEILRMADMVTRRLGDHHDREDAVQEFSLGALLAMRRARDGEAVGAYQEKYGRGYVKRYLHRLRRWQSREPGRLDAPIGHDGDDAAAQAPPPRSAALAAA